mmetsp:Transcript_52591/g.94414  ORF Transcript_52591/g.94414 Transcript_52591/m.94414 type:complete len:384 (-) Transcript_52591:23-1174(-)
MIASSQPLCAQADRGASTNVPFRRLQALQAPTRGKSPLHTAIPTNAALGLLGAVWARSCRSTQRGRKAMSAVSQDELSSPPSCDVALFTVPVRRGAQSVVLKRLMHMPSPSFVSNNLPRSGPAVLLLHDGPGLNYSCLEPLARRLCAKAWCTCYVYDRLECGVPTRDNLQNSIQDLQDVLRYTQDSLCEPELHIAGHGLGGIIVMEALLRGDIWGPLESLWLPKLKSVSLISTASDTGLMRTEAIRLYRQIKKEVGADQAASKFWSEHSRSGSDMIAEAYSETMWEPWFDWLLRGWHMKEEEVMKKYIQATGGVPLLSLRGEHDFVTAKCMQAWRAVGAAMRNVRRGWFAEEILPSCGHNLHLQDPDACASVLQRFMLQAGNV